MEVSLPISFLVLVIIVLGTQPKLLKAIVEGVNMVKRHTKPSAESPKGGIIEKQLPVAISNLSLLTKSGDKTKVGYRFEDGKKVRYSKKSNEIL